LGGITAQEQNEGFFSRFFKSVTQLVMCWGTGKTSKQIILQNNITQLFSDSRKGKSISRHI
jgi:hypothetical protein